jgi:2-oxoisovalerate dehydrogenase E1 component
MGLHPGLVLMGQDIGAYGGVFKVTDGFVARFGESRVRNTPLCESAVVGAALGYHISSGEPAMMEMQFADFVTCGFNQIVNYLAKLHYRWGQTANVVIRMPTGGGMGAGPFHSQSNEAWFTHVPGLRVVYPSTPYDAKGLLLEAFADPNPVMFFEHKGLYRSVSGPVPEEPYRIPFGKARVVQEGAAATIITYGQGVKWAEEACPSTGSGQAQSDVEIIDLRTLAPLDMDTVLASVRKTGRALILHEDNLFGGIGGEIAAQINEQAFAALDAPVMRVGGAETPIPFSKELEGVFMPTDRLKEKIEELMGW